MQIVLPPELEHLIQQQIAAGRYQSALEVITAGVSLLEQQDALYKGRLPELQQDAQLGWEAVQRGDVAEGPMAMAQIRANLRTRHANSDS